MPASKRPSAQRPNSGQPVPTRPFTVGELAERSGVSRSAIRFYEKRGLIEATRTAGNHRLFPREALRLVSVIRAAQAVGLSLDEIGAALDRLPGDRAPTHADWRRISRRWRDDLEARLAALQLLRDDLGACIGCGCLSLESCPLFNPNDAARTLGTGPRYLLGDTATDAEAAVSTEPAAPEGLP